MKAIEALYALAEKHNIPKGEITEWLATYTCQLNSSYTLDKSLDYSYLPYDKVEGIWRQSTQDSLGKRAAQLSQVSKYELLETFEVVTLSLILIVDEIDHSILSSEF